MNQFGNMGQILMTGIAFLFEDMNYRQNQTLFKLY